MLIKGSSLVATISVVELTFTAQRFLTSTYRPFEVFAVAAVIYMAIIYVVSRGIDALEARYAFR
jgi:polar amino acid transport system permease protein